ncbi:3-carboxyethylcatechol 2,3-dioxygenase [Streptomyces sp. NBC_01762]|uniref:3-carboxyethylcatechol 2,3-dioxygenase n=1 Tax=unclassified Streptomyces TaxID=2593676 RepID=UPI002DDB8F13|nr:MULTISPECIES: 3-carboxyethylcatechol 2,3-dioxygenase [unclassified Streptomyces]WSC48468.1 3-carboxyethylcatechol 2,3-dioxygenase [Streptomyces sp. NBC_01762]WSC52565.1 3-carboxyethylcatechol 2,3-dioxygenase [Streptomyces sp. NBC_01761]WSD28120.1 3-carboxyethylcatechol 2,3-dioxygenase [Streptomyces sp. NBC_01751]WSJ49880.1 3-carboxyethylcatechol 2,3-dioxygenase [Streptomyces sp. NBC_01318]
MPLALCCLSHSPLMEYVHPQADVRGRVDEALAGARRFVEDFDPELVVIFAPDHYNGFFYDMMPPFCIGGRAQAIGDFGTPEGPLSVDHEAALAVTRSVLADGVDTAMSQDMVVDHGFSQPLDILLGGIDKKPVVPVFINSVAEPFVPVSRVRALGEAVGRAAAELDKRVLMVGSGGLSHDPPVPRMAQADTEEKVRKLINNRNPSDEARAARQARTIAAAEAFAAGSADLHPLNPAWDNLVLDTLGDPARLREVDGWTSEWFTEEAGNSAHEVRTWIAAHAALSAAGEYRTRSRYYEAIEAWIAGFGVVTATLVPAF